MKAPANRLTDRHGGRVESPQDLRGNLLTSGCNSVNAFSSPNFRRSQILGLARGLALASRVSSAFEKRVKGRLLAFVRSRLGAGKSSAGEDVVQETFIGFLNSLPNYDARRPLEGWLFSIASHKLTDYLRREGRRRIGS